MKTSIIVWTIGDIVGLIMFGLCVLGFLMIWFGQIVWKVWEFFKKGRKRK